MHLNNTAAAPTHQYSMRLMSIYIFFLYTVLVIRCSTAFTHSPHYSNKYNVNGGRGRYSDTTVATALSSSPPTFVSRLYTPSSSSLLHSQRSKRPNLHQLSLGLFDFLKSRSNDFVKLDSTDDIFGPGPILVLYNVPDGISDEEFGYMVEDGAPRTTSPAGGRGVAIQRLSKEDKEQSSTLEMTLSDALEQMVKQGNKEDKKEEEFKLIEVNEEIGTTQPPSPMEESSTGSPVLFFSGFSNSEMMETYKIIASEIYQESGGALSAACAKAVPNAMDKPLIQVLEEISGDHADALRMRREQQQEEEQQVQE